VQGPYLTHNKWGKRILSPEGEALFRVMWEADFSNTQIAEALGIISLTNHNHLRSIRRFRRKLGLTPRPLSMRVRRGLPKREKVKYTPRPEQPSPERVEGLRAMWAAGASWAEIRETLKMGNAMLRRLRVELDLPRRLQPNAWTKEQEAYLVENWVGLLSRADIAKHIGRTVGACEQMARALSLMPESYRWSTAMDDTLIRMKNEGKSYADIGAVLGVTKNACIGRGQRLGIKAPPRPQKPPKPTHSWRKRRSPARPPLRAKKSGRVPSSPVPALPPINGGLTFAENNGCMWETSDQPRLYCGHPKVDRGSYCEHHRQAACTTRPKSDKPFIFHTGVVR
jgi:hypothetical protein